MFNRPKYISWFNPQNIPNGGQDFHQKKWAGQVLRLQCDGN